MIIAVCRLCCAGTRRYQVFRPGQVQLPDDNVPRRRAQRVRPHSHRRWLPLPPPVCTRLLASRPPATMNVSRLACLFIFGGLCSRLLACLVARYWFSIGHNAESFPGREDELCCWLHPSVAGSCCVRGTSGSACVVDGAAPQPSAPQPSAPQPSALAVGCHCSTCSGHAPPAHAVLLLGSGCLRAANCCLLVGPRWPVPVPSLSCAGVPYSHMVNKVKCQGKWDACEVELWVKNKDQ